MSAASLFQLLPALLSGKTDLTSAAKSLGVAERSLSPGELESAFVHLATAAEMPGAEVIELQGAPAILKGRAVRVIAVLQPAPAQNGTLPDGQKKTLA